MLPMMLMPLSDTDAIARCFDYADIDFHLMMPCFFSSFAIFAFAVFAAFDALLLIIFVIFRPCHAAIFID